MTVRSFLLQSLADLIVSVHRPHPLRVAVDGISAAGKTFLAGELVQPLQDRGRTVIRASVDGFHRARAERYRLGPNSPQGYYHDAFDYAALRVELLLPLGPCGDRRYRLATFDYLADSPVLESPHTAPHDAVLLCDGVFLLRPELDDCWDFRIFLDVDEQVAVRRASGRDQELFGAERAVRARYWTRYVPAHRIYLEAARPLEQVDALIDNNDPLNPRLLRPVCTTIVTVATPRSLGADHS